MDKQGAGWTISDDSLKRAAIPATPALFRGRGVKKGPANPISLVSADLRWQRGQPPMPHPSSHAGPVPAPAVPCPAGTGDQQPVTALSGPGLGVPVSIWPHAPVPGSGPGPGPGCALCASCMGTGSGPDAAQIITAFSRPGELVVIPGARDGALLAVGTSQLLCRPIPTESQPAPEREL